MSGSGERCAWCGAPGATERVAVSEGTALPVCSVACGSALVQANQELERRLKPFLGLLAVSLLMMIGGALGQLAAPGLRAAVPLGLALLGLTIVWAPIVTPQTVTLFGLRRGMAIARGIGGAIVAGAAVLLATGMY